MTFKSTTALVCAGIALAGCGSGGSGSVSSNAVSAIFPSNFRDAGETEYEALEEGLVYYIGDTAGNVNEFLVRIDRNGTPNNPNDDELIVRRNGGAPITYTPLSVTDNGSELSTIWVFAENTFDELQFQVIVDSDSNPSDSQGIFRVNFPMESIGPQNFGRGGLETRVANLPNSATYSGNFLTDALEFVPETDPNAAPGQLRAIGVQAIDTFTNDTTVNFASGNITGTHNGTSFLGASNQSVSGDINGTVEGSRVGGTLTVNGGATGTLQFGGLFTGATGNNLVGGVAGTVSQDGESHDVGGDFRLGQTSAN